jgi:hypothetical protein
MVRAVRVFLACLAVCGLAAAARGQASRVTVVDQTGLPLPGVLIEVFTKDIPAGTLRSEADGTFSIEGVAAGTSLVLSLEGFDSARVTMPTPDRIVLYLARATDSTVVVAPETVEASPSAERLGSTLTTTSITRLPSAHMQARESLPLLPSVIRGADGLMQLGGARAYQTPLTLDGFNVTDPATGLSSLNLPLEAIGIVEALRDPMSVTSGGLLGGVIRLESKVGGAERASGVQGFIPRPRFSSPGFGRLEGIFPRAFVSGSAADARIRYTIAGEYDYERIPVPDVTDQTGRDLIEESGILFGRMDVQLTAAHSISVEAFSFPTATKSFGLSPRRDVAATVNLGAHDRFAGLTHRIVSATRGVFTMRAAAFGRTAHVTPNGTGPSLLTPGGWNGNWFSNVMRHAERYMASGAWDRPFRFGRWTHDVTATGEFSSRSLKGRVAEESIAVSDTQGAVVRSVAFGPTSTIGASDRLAGAALRDVWRTSGRFDVDMGVRVDHGPEDAAVPSARIGLRYGLDSSGRTTLRTGIGRFVGTVPLAASAFGGYPARIDRLYSTDTGEATLLREVVLKPSVGPLQLPRARAIVIGLERNLSEGLDGQIVFTDRRSRNVTTLTVPVIDGPLTVGSTGSGSYRELQVSMRRTWPHDQVLFVSYVQSRAIGELNEFAAMFQAMDTPILQPGGRARTTNDARHRILAWGTFNLPRRIVVSPVTEIRSGFPFSALTSRYTYAGAPQARTFPVFMATDLVTYKTVTVRGRTADVGLQIFNVTNHRNPRDVFPVSGAARFGQFANSVGPIFRGYLLLKW